MAAEFFAPFEVVDDNGGNLYITDTYNFRVREMYPLPLATEELSKNVQVTLYPNPNQGIFTIQIANSPKADQPVVNSQVEIYNMLGEKIYSKQFNIQNSAFKIDISNQPNGIYILKAQTADGNAFVKRLEIIR